MPLDTSIYSNIQTPQAPSLVNAAQTAATLSQLGMQQQQQQMAMQTQMATRQALASNTDQNGNLNQAGALSQLGKINPTAAIALGGQFSQANQAKAESQAAQIKAQSVLDDEMLPKLQYLKSAPADQQPDLYETIKAQFANSPIHNEMAQNGHAPPPLPDTLDPKWLDAAIGGMSARTSALNNQKTQAETAEKQAQTAKAYNDIGLVPLQRNAEAFGARSPYSTQQDAYNKEVGNLRGSQMSMQQMLDNYKHPSPQGDASLVLNAFKIKFPNAPDVNSLEELHESQATIDKWKNLFNQSSQGGFDQPTRDNLIRDAYSTFSANTATLRGSQEKYRDIAKQNNLPNSNFTNEPGFDKTYAEASDLSKQVGPYVKPSDRGGVTGAVSGFLSNLVGSGGSKTASASEQKPSQMRAAGAPVSQDEVAQYATKHGMSASAAQSYLKGKGYVIGR